MTSKDSVRDALAAAWLAVLNVPAVSREDNFFETGGDSLAAVEFAARVEDSLGVMVPLEVLILDGTFGGLLDAIVGASSEVFSPE